MRFATLESRLPVVKPVSGAHAMENPDISRAIQLLDQAMAMQSALESQLREISELRKDQPPVGLNGSPNGETAETLPSTMKEVYPWSGMVERAA
jgi:hypothetical protein